jgi:hypothetical protein
MLMRRITHPGTWGLIFRRVWDELKRNHVDEFFREYPELHDYYRAGDHELIIPTNDPKKPSKIVFAYAETLEEVKRKFMGQQYMDIFVDQGEQLTEQEHKELKQSCRWPGTTVGDCKYAIFFNMGGPGIQFLKRVFHTKDYRGKERQEDFAFLQAHAWDNFAWVEPALRRDGFELSDYYGWPEARREKYCASQSDYGINLTSTDEALIKRDWKGSWDSLEGAYFGAVYDRDATVISREQVHELIKPWHSKWLSQDWGRSHYCSTHWHSRVQISPQQAKDVLGWEVSMPLSLVITYREYMAGGLAVLPEESTDAAEMDICREIIKRTPEPERQMIHGFFLSPDAFAKKTSDNTIAVKYGVMLRDVGMPYPAHADDDRVGGWSLMYNMLLATKRKGIAQNGVDPWLISADCPQLQEAIPLLMRDPKNLDDVTKTDKGRARIEQDVADDVRYGLKSMLGLRHKPAEETMRERALQIEDPAARWLYVYKEHHRIAEAAQPKKDSVVPGWTTRA